MGLLEREEWWLTEYPVEIHSHLRQKERSRGAYHSQSPQISLRRPLLELLDAVCDTRGLCTLVKHVAVNLLDFFMDHYVVDPEQLQLLALSCLLLAAKSEEKDILIPKVSDLNSYSDNVYQLSDFVTMEIILLDFFHWDLLVPTAAHFLEYYALFAVSQDEACNHHGLGGDHNAGYYIHKYTQYFLESALKDPSFVRFPASMIAAACIFSTRVCLLLNPAWPPTLQKTTDYSWSQLGTCSEKLLRKLEEEEAERNRNTNFLDD